MVYDDFDFSWLLPCYSVLGVTGSLFLQTDYRSVAEVKLFADKVFKTSGGLINWIVWPYDWGGRPRKAFGRKHDDILWYAKSCEYKFYPKRVQIPKKTAKSGGLNPSGRTTKTPTDVWGDIGNFLTTSSERVHDETGKCVPWQKPERLIERIVLATTDEGDLVVDPFLGTGTTGVVCKKLNRRFFGMDCNLKMMEIARRRLSIV
jgi:DNA modification methylase